MEQDHQQELAKDLESQKFEQVGNIYKCRECGESKPKHALIINCPKKESPQKKYCFKCQGAILRPYVFSQKRHSRKNNWDYWTEKESDKGKYICNSCLLDFYYNNKFQYLQKVQNPKKRNIFKVYVYNKTIA